MTQYGDIECRGCEYNCVCYADMQSIIDYGYGKFICRKDIKKDKEIERLNAIIDKLNEKGKFLTEIANEKQNRIDRAMAYNNYLKEKCCYRLNEGHLRKMGKILIGEETELKEIPRVGDDKE